MQRSITNGTLEENIKHDVIAKMTLCVFLTIMELYDKSENINKLNASPEIDRQCKALSEKIIWLINDFK